MNKIELVQKIGDTVCEGCGPDVDCGLDPATGCDRINCAIVLLNEYMVEQESKQFVLRDVNRAS